MRLSSTDIYAFQALAYLGLHYTQQGQTQQAALQEGPAAEPVRWIASEEISEATGVARPYLVRILAALSARGLVQSKKGIGGGYRLSLPPQQMSLRDVVRAIDGPVAPLSCVSLTWAQNCPEEERCHVRHTVYTRMRDAMLSVLEEFSVADLVQDAQRGVSYSHCLEHLLRPSP